MGNAKLSTAIGTFSLPAGWSCNFAKECYSKADRKTGTITDGKNCQFRCFAASEECVFTNVRQARWRNFEMLKNAKSLEKMANLIQRSLPFGIGIIRVHPSGDFFNETYFLAWLNVALNNPMLICYGYTKCIPFLIKYKKHIPSNFRFTASMGGKCDNLVKKHKLRYAQVIFSTEEARRKNLPVDHDDSEALYGKQNFLLLLHGKQPAGSNAAIALRQLKSQGLGAYNEKTKQTRMEKDVLIHITLKNGQVYIPALVVGENKTQFQPKYNDIRSFVKT
jgi:hypothetical protein